MDNFRRYRPNNHGRPGTTDGFVSPARTRRLQSNAQRSAETKPTTRKIGDFKATDGFHPANRRERWSSPTGDQATPHKSSAPAPSGKIKLDMPTSAPMKGKRHRRGLRARLRGLFFNPFKPSNWTKKRAAASMAMALVLVGGYFGANLWLRANQIFQGGGGAAALQDTVDPARLRGEGDGRVNILLLGRGGDGHAGVDLTDTILIASIDPIQKEAAILSIPRDLYVRAGGGYTKINAVFANAKENAGGNEQQGIDAGFKAIEEIIQTKIGIPIHYHAVVDFEGFKKGIDTVGGVDVDVPESAAVHEVMTIDNKRYTLNVPAGQQHFDGMRALAYARSRHASPRGDFDRAERQRLLMVALKNKIFSAGTYSNPIKVNQLMSDFGNHIQANMSLGEVMRLYEIGKEIDSAKIASVGLADPPNNYVTTDMVHGLSVVVPRAGLDNYKEIQAFVRNRLRDGFLASENASVTVLNGTSIPGLATRTADDLRSYGYNVGQVGDAPTQSYQQTVIIDMRSGEKKYTKRYLENRFKLSITNTLPDAQINPGSADFVIILGQNEQARLQD